MRCKILRLKFCLVSIIFREIDLCLIRLQIKSENAGFNSMRKKMFVCNFNFSKIASLIQGSTHLKNCLNQRLLLASRQILVYAFTLKVSILNKSKGSNKLNRHFSKEGTPLGSEHKLYLAIIFIQKFFYSPQKFGQSEIYLFYLRTCMKSNIYLVLC